MLKKGVETGRRKQASIRFYIDQEISEISESTQPIKIKGVCVCVCCMYILTSYLSLPTRTLI